MRIGKTLFYIGVLIAAILGIGNAINARWAANEWVALLLVVVGLVVGFMNIEAKEGAGFLLAAVAFVIAAALGNLMAFNTLIPKIGSFLQGTIGNIALIVAPAALVVSLKAIISACK
ncbi:MAG TPA: hypothetical protein VJC07_02120 [Candidatus Nanoarchaeia archaeon]|nr:hypothetical protein [Candidatus Nanoarchaeia archaeon]